MHEILLDACVDRYLATHIVGHDVRTAHQMGWSAVKNGSLLTLAVDNAFDAFVTVDRGISFQQNLGRYAIALILLRAATNRFDDLLPLVPRLLAALPMAGKGELTQIV